MTCAKIVALLLILGGSPAETLASDLQSPRTVALGGAGRANPLLNDSITLNPSYTSLLPSYSVAANYLKPDAGMIYNVSIQDGRTELFQAGLSFTKRSEGKLISFGASKAFVKRYGVGLGGKVFYDNAQAETVHEMNVSATFLALPWLQAAFMADNLIQNETSKRHAFYREFALGTKFNIQRMLLIYVDPHLIPDLPGSSSFGHEVGVELAVMKDVFLRAGRFTRSKLPTAMEYGSGTGLGFGWIGPRLSMDYAFSRTETPRRENTHVMGITMYF